MGYRSTVGIKCQSGAYEKFKAAWDRNMFSPHKILTDDNQTEYILIWEWVKWNDFYEEVAAIEQVMDELDEYANDEAWENKMAYKKLELGEDDTDVTHRQNSYNISLYYIREIDTDGMKELRL